ncbi:MAG TPA: hypothetical protein VNY29_15605 [Terriglobales bacterium]|nr:hypothetical protein [Terriglobales bacterium]
MKLLLRKRQVNELTAALLLDIRKVGYLFQLNLIQTPANGEVTVLRVFHQLRKDKITGLKKSGSV